LVLLLSYPLFSWADFGNRGIVTTVVGIYNSEADSIVLQPDGKLVAGGYCGNGPNMYFALARYNGDGTPDLSFSLTGQVVTPVGVGYCLLRQPDGKLVAAGGSVNDIISDFALVRYNTNGSLDASFGNGGKVTTTIEANTGYFVTSMIIQSDGKLVAAGHNVNSDSAFALVRYNSNGSLDTGFGINGVVKTRIGGTYDAANCLLLQPDGKLVAAGVTYIDGSNKFALARYNSNGGLDTAFGNSGTVAANVGEEIHGLVMLPNGKFVAEGYRNWPANDLVLARFNQDGSLDISFGSGGSVYSPLGSAYSLGNNSLALQADGKLVVAGGASNGTDLDFSLARYNGDGSLDVGFGTGGKILTCITGSNDAARSLVVQPDGKLVAVGTGGTVFALVRYNSDGTLDGANSPLTPSRTPTPLITPAPTSSFTVTATPTPVPANFWRDDFIGTAGQKPAGWQDQTDVAAFNAAITYQGGTYARIAKRSSAVWGKVLSPLMSCDVSIYKNIEVKIQNVNSQTSWKIGIQEEEGAYRYWDLNVSTSVTGIFRYDLAAVTGWSGQHAFRVQLTAEGAGIYTVDWVRIHKGSVIPATCTATVTRTRTITRIPTYTRTPTRTATPTRTPTFTRTPTRTPSLTRTGTSTRTPIFSATPTPTITLTPTSTRTYTITVTPTSTPYSDNAWLDDFKGVPNTKPGGWQDDADDPNFNAVIFYGDYEKAFVNHTMDGTWGKVLSPGVTCDVSVFPQVEIRVDSVLGPATWKMGIQELGGAWQYWDLSTSQANSGTYMFNFASVTGWTGVHQFAVQITIECVGQYGLMLDYVRVCQPGTVHGASAGGTGKSVKLIASSLTCTLTPTPSPTPSITATPVVTFSPTSTPTTGVRMDEGTVLVYPNPARGRVNFAYEAQGAAKAIIDIYRLTGERVAHIEERKDGGAGQTFITAWEAAGVAPGIYFCRIVVTGSEGKEVLNMKKKVALVR
jgi:uncharacterized delta-60 repeat protein